MVMTVYCYTGELVVIQKLAGDNLVGKQGLEAVGSAIVRVVQHAGDARLLYCGPVLLADDAIRTHAGKDRRQQEQRSRNGKEKSGGRTPARGRNQQGKKIDSAQQQKEYQGRGNPDAAASAEKRRCGRPQPCQQQKAAAGMGGARKISSAAAHRR